MKVHVIMTSLDLVLSLIFFFGPKLEWNCWSPLDPRIPFFSTPKAVVELKWPLSWPVDLSLFPILFLCMIIRIVLFPCIKIPMSKSHFSWIAFAQFCTHLSDPISYFNKEKSVWKINSRVAMFFPHIEFHMDMWKPIALHERTRRFSFSFLEFEGVHCW